MAKKMAKSDKDKNPKNKKPESEHEEQKSEAPEGLEDEAFDEDEEDFEDDEDFEDEDDEDEELDEVEKKLRQDLGLDKVALEEPEVIPEESGPEIDAFIKEDGEVNTDPDAYLRDADTRKEEMLEDLNNPVIMVERVYQIWWHWADFHLYIISPMLDTLSPPVVIPPEPLPGSSDRQFVYPIHDSGSKLSTSKAEDMFYAGKSMCKLYYTIEKMVGLLIERLKAQGVSQETEVQVAFGGHQLAQRKAFESIINLSYNVVVTNFDPGVWGERYLQTVKLIADKGYGYPSEAPRHPFDEHLGSSKAKSGK